jgi:hypothetical protein
VSAPMSDTRAPVSLYDLESDLRDLVANLRDPDSKLRTDRAVAAALEAVLDRHFTTVR